MHHTSLLVALIACQSPEARHAERETLVARARVRLATLPAGATEVPRRHLLRDQFALGAEAAPAPVRLVVRDTAGWRDAWRRLTADSAATPVPVDFGREQVLVVWDSLRLSTGYERDILTTYTHGDSLIVVVWVQGPGAGCSVGDAATRPRHVIALSRLSQPVYWREVGGPAPPCA